jgi:hypothetical protein
MKSNQALPSLQLLGLRTLRLLKLSPRTYNELADKLCVCRRYAEQVVQHLRTSGFIIHSRTEQRQKLFWTTAEADFLPTVLTEAERKEVEVLLTGQNLHLQTAFYKLTQLLRS